jgi:hypothetical protein
MSLDFTTPDPGPRGGEKKKKDPPPPERPTVFEHLLLLSGAAISLALYRFGLLPIEMNTQREWVHEWTPFVQSALRLPEGIILLWPILRIVQVLRGRKQGLTSAEWLLVFAWLGLVLLNGLAGWMKYAPESVFEIIKNNYDVPFILWYVIITPSMGLFALVVGLLGLFSRTPTPWTHSLAIAVFLWMTPLAAWLLLMRTA